MTLLRPTLIPGLPRVWRGPHTLQLGLDPTRAVLLDLPDPRAAALLDLLDGTRPERAVLSRMARAGVTHDDCLALLDTLHAAGYVRSAPGLLPSALPDRERRRLAGEAAALALADRRPGGATPPVRRSPSAGQRRAVTAADHGPSPAQILRRRLAARVIISGRGRLGEPIAVALAEAGVGHLHPDIPRQAGAPTRNGYDLVFHQAEAMAAASLAAHGRASHGRGPHGPAPRDPLPHRLVSHDPEPHGAASFGPPPHGSASHGLASPDLGDVRAPTTARPRTAAEEVTAAIRRVAPDIETRPIRRGTATLVIQLGHDQPVALLAAGHAARSQAHLAVAIREGAAVVGPLVPPRGGPCLRCIDLHRCDRDPDWAQLSAQLGSIDTEPCRATTVMAAAALAAAEALTYLDGGAPETLGAALEVSTPGRVRRRTWPPHPRCDCNRRR